MTRGWDPGGRGGGGETWHRAGCVLGKMLGRFETQGLLS